MKSVQKISPFGRQVYEVWKNTTLQFCIAPRRKYCTEKEKEWLHNELNRIQEALTNALEFLGAGAKTAAGYGRFEQDESAKKKREMEENRIIMQELPPDERMREEISQLSEDQLAKMFGRDFNKTQQRHNDTWINFIQMTLKLHGKTIRSWESSPNKNMKKAYKKLIGSAD